MKQSAATSFIEPMMARLVERLPTGKWLYELKFDGYRALAFKTGQEVRLVSRNRVEFKYPQLANALKSLPAQNAIIDGEIAALDDEGRSSFQLLQGYGSGEQGPPLIYYAFDLLSLNGTDLRNRPLIERRKLLAKLLKKAPDNIRFSEELRGSAAELLRVARQFQLEGLIAKKPDSLYESGRRSGAWVKVKLTQEQEFVIGGYTLPEGSRKYFGALLVGYYQANRLLFAGRVGTGFSERALAELYGRLRKIRRETKSRHRSKSGLRARGCTKDDQTLGSLKNPFVQSGLTADIFAVGGTDPFSGNHPYSALGDGYGKQKADCARQAPLLTGRNCKGRRFELRPFQSLSCSKSSVCPGCCPGFWNNVFNKDHWSSNPSD
jgi:DNA ligase D-like protein (predicted ligase)